MVIFDGVTDARTMLGGALNIKLDTIKPEPPEALELLDAADSGVSNIDNMTNKDQPAFAGTGEPNAKVRLYVAAKDPLTGDDAGPRELVGQSVVTTTGEWEITTQPLVDNFYNVYVVTEDLAGNISMLMNAVDVTLNANRTDPGRWHAQCPVDDRGLAVVRNRFTGDRHPGDHA